MAYVLETHTNLWTAVDLVHHFGAIPLRRVIFDPSPGAATVADVVRLSDHEDRLYELIDGTLVEKTVGIYESMLAMSLGALITEFVKANRLGVVTGEGVMMEICPGQVRIPDVSFVSWQRLEGSGFPENPVPALAPDLAMEILSKSNTPLEMERKLRDNFDAGVRLDWNVDAQEKTVRVYTAVDQVATLSESDSLTGGDVLPGFEVSLGSYFAIPEPGSN